MPAGIVRQAHQQIGHRYFGAELCGQPRQPIRAVPVTPPTRHADDHPWVAGEDGSVDIYLQAASPGADKEANWLPAPNGKFSVMLRLYWPKEGPISFLNGSWKPPPIKRAA